MIRHVVMWRFEENAEGKTRLQNMEYIRDRLMALLPIIPEIKRMEIGFDVLHSDMSYDMILLTEFDSLDDLNYYKNHPDHVAVSQYVAKVRTSRVVCDCEI